MTSEHEDRVAELAVEVLDSFEKLEILLVLAHATTAIPLEPLAAALALDRGDAIAELDALVRHGVMVSGPDGYSLVYDGAWTGHVRSLVALHRIDRLRVVTLMAKASVERIRAHAARALLDTPSRAGGKPERAKPERSD